MNNRAFLQWDTHVHSHYKLHWYKHLLDQGVYRLHLVAFEWKQSTWCSSPFHLMHESTTSHYIYICFYQWLGQGLPLRNEVVNGWFINNINLPTLSFTVPIVLPLHAAWYSFPYLAIRFFEICNKKRGNIAISVSNAANPCVK